MSMRSAHLRPVGAEEPEWARPPSRLLEVHGHATNKKDVVHSVTYESTIRYNMVHALLYSIWYFKAPGPEVWFKALRNEAKGLKCL